MPCAGDAELVVIEADESDGTIALYEPTVSVLTNISLDHKPMAELESLFGSFCERASDAVVVNRQCERSMALTQRVKRRVTFGVDCEGADVHAVDVALLPDGVRCVVNGAIVSVARAGPTQCCQCGGGYCRVWGAWNQRAGWGRGIG